MNELEYRMYKSKLVMDRAQKEKDRFLNELINKNFSFTFIEKMKMVQYHNATYKLIFKRSDYSKEQTVCFAIRKARINNCNCYFVCKCTEKGLGHTACETDNNDVIERAINRIIDTINKSILHSEAAYLENKCLLEFEKIEKGR